MFKPIPVLATVLAITPSLSYAAISLVFSDFTATLSNISDSQGLAGVNDLAWGIMIDTDANGFSAPLASSVGLKLDDGADFGSGYLFYYGGETATVPIGAEPGNGVIGTTRSMDVYSSASVSQSDAFALVWFNTGMAEGDDLPVGSNYGILTNAGYTVPPENSNNFSFSDLSVGADPIRPANLELVPEPSTAFLAILGLSGLFRRRR